MYYSRGNFEAYARPLKPECADRKRVYIVGSGIAALSAAAFCIRDAQMDGRRIRILEKNPVPGGALDGYHFENIGSVFRADRQIRTDYECLWELFRDIPSASDPEISVLEEFYRQNKKDPNYSLCRATVSCGTEVKLEGKYGLTDRAARSVVRLFFLPDEELYRKKISDVLGNEVMGSNFWFYLRTLYGFEGWHSALELKRHLRRFITGAEGLPDLKSLTFTKYNQYETFVQPLVSYLEEHGVVFDYGVRVLNVAFDCGTSRKKATRIDILRDGGEDSIDLTSNDLVFITNGGITENTGIGSQDEPSSWNPELQPGGGWDLWKNIAVQSSMFGHPEVFCSNPEHTNRVSATITTLDRSIIPYIKKISKRDPFSGKTVTGGIITVRDSSWMLNWSVGRQPRFRDQGKNQVVISVYGLFTDKPGDFIGKIMRDCSGTEICEEWLYHLGVPESQIRDLAENHARTVPVVMPYVSSVYMPRSAGDRPAVVPEGAVNFAFIGQFAETAGEAALTVEYSVRTAMEAVYTLLSVDRGVPEAAGEELDLRVLMDAFVYLRDGRKLSEMKHGIRDRLFIRKVLKKMKRTDILKMLREHNVL